MNVFDKLGGWTLGKKYDEGVLTGIKVTQHETVELDIDYGKSKMLFEWNPVHQQWRQLKQDAHNKLMDARISALPLRNRAKHVLRSHGITRVEMLLQHSALDLLRFRNFGRGSLTEVEEFLGKHNLKLQPTIK